MSEPSKEHIYSATSTQVLRFLWVATKKHHWFFAVMFLVVTLGSVCSVLVPVQMKRVIDVITSQAPSATVATSIAGLIASVVVYKLLFGLFFRTSGFLSLRRVPKIMAELEETALQGVLVHSHRFFSENQTGGVVRRITRLSESYMRLHSNFYWNMLGAFVVAAAVIVQLLLTKPAAAGILSVWLVILIALNVRIARWKTPADAAYSRAQSTAQGLLADIVASATTVKLFAREVPEANSFHRGLEERILTQSVAWKRSEYGLVISDVLGALMHGGVLFLLLWWWEKGQVTVGDFVLLQSFVVLITERLFSIGFAYRDFIEALVNASEIVGILKAPVSVQDKTGARTLQVTQGTITFSKVGFKYEKRQVLKEFTLQVGAQEKIAFIGPSGAGKSTIVKLLLRFYDTTKGKILIDGQDIAHVTQQSLRSQISLVPQDPVLFHRSLRENIGYGRTQATLSEIIEAAKQAHCHEFISKLPEGYDTQVGERGVKLSGGERQRVAIARAILADTPILILDEATSALDSESEQLIQQALAQLMKHKTVIVIAHRLSTVMSMDRIIVMEQGKIVDSGTHQELLTKLGTYQKLWSIQVGGYQSTYTNAPRGTSCDE